MANQPKRTIAIRTDPGARDRSPEDDLYPIYTGETGVFMGELVVLRLMFAPGFDSIDAISAGRETALGGNFAMTRDQAVAIAKALLQEVDKLDQGITGSLLS